MIATLRSGVYLPAHLRVLLQRVGVLAWVFCRLPLSAHLPSWPLCFSGKTRTKDKYRVVYTDHQRLELEKEFHYSRYITIRRKSELAANLGLTERQVCGSLHLSHRSSTGDLASRLQSRLRSSDKGGEQRG